jgi:hypothetical protein
MDPSDPLTQLRDSLARQQELLARQVAHQQELLARQVALPPPPPLDPAQWTTTVAEARQIAEQDVHRSWVQAAYADVAQRLAKMDERLDALEATLSLLHAKMETLIMRLAIDEEDPEA